MMTDRLGELRIVSQPGVPLSTGWLAGFVIPPGVSVELVELGRRCNVQVVSGEHSVTMLADLVARRALLPGDDVDHADLVALARELLARRASALSERESQDLDGSPLLQIAAAVPGSRWVMIG